MKKINSINEIDFSAPDTFSINITYVFPKGVLVNINKYPNGKLDIRVTNANYNDADFHGKSFGNNYEEKSWFDQHLAYWIECSGR